MPVITSDPKSFLGSIEMGLGAWSWGDRTFWHYGHDYTDEDIEAALISSIRAGINLVDTAEVYGGGHSEQLLGKLIKKIGQPVRVATKFFPLPYRLTRASVVRTLRGSLERLGLEYIDLYQLHWPSPVIPNSIYIEGLVMAAQAGLTHTVGVSNYDPRQMQQAHQILSQNGIPLVSNQVEYHLLDRKVERNGLLDKCREMGIRLIAYSPLAQGLLSGKYTTETPPSGPRGRKYASILKQISPLIALLNEIGAGHGNKTPSQVALNWVICKGGLPIPGAKNARQAEENAGAIGWRLTAEEIRILDSASDKIV
jgi:aryl-alcohol dehydrogenase-like predicted oxidoreductase